MKDRLDNGSPIGGFNPLNKRNERIEFNKEVFALLITNEYAPSGTNWFGDPHEALQASRMNYGAGKEFRAHKHILNPRIIKKTQEAFIVIKGKIEVEIFDDEKRSLGVLEARPGEAIFVYRGYHLVRVIEDCIAYEVKAGSFTVVSEDKEFK